VSLPTPYYHNEAAGITIYHGDARLVLPVIDPASVSLLLTDPPYGVSERTSRGSNGRGTAFGGKPGGTHIGATDFPPVFGDDQPFDPAPLLRFPVVALFGANHFADQLPPSASWVVWDKLDGLTTKKRAIGLDDNADCELIWTNTGGPARLIPHRWKGLVKASERGETRVHPTQKPVALMRLLLDIWTDPGNLVLDPYMGSGPIARAAFDMGRRYIGIEIEERYCEIAARRLQQSVLPLGEVA